MSDSVRTPKVVLLGRPNVGKSTLFNRLIRSNRAITHDRPGVTRDRMEGIVRSRNQENFFLVDTGGVTLDGHARVEQGPEGIRGFEEAILEQAREAVRESDLLCLVVDARDGLTPFDRHLADFLRRQGKPLLLVVNKVDGPEKADILLAEFHELGLDMMPCSAAHGFNIRTLEEELRERLFPAPPEEEEALEPGRAVLFEGASRRQKKRLKTALAEGLFEEAGIESPQDDFLPESLSSEIFDDAAPDLTEGDVLAEPEAEEPLAGGEDETSVPVPVDADATEASADAYSDPALASGPLRLCLLGRPNAGKSSLVNALVGESRMIVSDVAGTTRDSVDVTTEIDGEPCTFVDTAGVRRRAKITDTVERYSVNSSLKSTTKAHVTLLVLDAVEGLTLQDKRLIDLLYERKTPFLLLINKSDLIDQKKRKETEKVYKEALAFCPHVPILFVSAKNRYNLKKIVPLARAIRRECALRVPTGKLNRAMTEVLERHQPPIVGRGRAKFFYLTQAESQPPTFVFFVNDADKILASYARYLERSLRALFGIRHAPMRVHFRSSHSKKTKK